MDIETLQHIIAAIAALGAFGITATAVTQGIKKAFGLKGKSAFSLYWIVSIVVAIAGLILAGELDYASFTTENLATTITATAVVAKQYYEQFVKEAKPKKPKATA